MARRVYMSGDKILVSIPGIDALFATDAQLVLNSGGRPYNGSLLHGVIPHASFTQSTSGGITVRAFTLSFGKTFPVAPRLLWGAIDPNAGYGRFAPYYYRTQIGVWDENIEVNVTTTAAAWKLTQAGSGVGVASIAADIAYLIFAA